MNIFATQLQRVLQAHGKDMSSLFGLRLPDPRGGGDRPIAPHKVTRLKRSLTQDITATLNAEELAALQGWVPLDPAGEELRHLRAALVAEAVRHLLAGRMATDRADELASLTLQMLISNGEQALQSARATILDQVREMNPPGGEEWSGWGTLRSDPASGGPQGIAQASPHAEDVPVAEIEDAAETSEQGMLWLAVAGTTSDPIARRGYVSTATSLLTTARDALAGAALQGEAGQEQAAWLATISQALEQAHKTH